MDPGVFTSERPRLFAIAYRMLGSASDAEDVLQDAWLPEPVLTGDASRPDLQVERSETVTLAFLVLLEALSPANSRQLLRRAKQRLVERRPRLTGTAESRRAGRLPAATRS